MKRYSFGIKDIRTIWNPSKKETNVVGNLSEKGEISDSTTMRVSDFIEVKKGEKYYISFTHTQSVPIRVALYDMNKQFKNILFYVSSINDIYSPIPQNVKKVFEISVNGYIRCSADYRYSDYILTKIDEEYNFLDVSKIKLNDKKINKISFEDKTLWSNKTIKVSKDLKNNEPVILNFEHTPDIIIKGKCKRRNSYNFSETPENIELKDIIQWGHVVARETPEIYTRTRRINAQNYIAERRHNGLGGYEREKKIIAVRRPKNFTDEQRIIFQKYMELSFQRNYYQDNNNAITYQYEPNSKGAYWGNCSGFGCSALKKAGHFADIEITASDVSTNVILTNNTYFEDVPVIIEDNKIKNPEILKVGDALLYNGATTGFRWSVSHVEWVMEIMKDSYDDENSQIITVQGPLRKFINQFDKSNITSGTLNSNGEISSSSNSIVSDYINVENENIVSYKTFNVEKAETTSYSFAFYDSDKNYISDSLKTYQYSYEVSLVWITNKTFKVLIPENAKYVRVSMPKYDVDYAMIGTSGFIPMRYCEYNKSTVYCDYHGSNIIFYSSGKNKYNYNDGLGVNPSKYINETGSESDNENYNIARYMNVHPTQHSGKYTLSYEAGENGLIGNQEQPLKINIIGQDYKGNFIKNLGTIEFDGTNDMQPNERRSIIIDVKDTKVDYLKVALPKDINASKTQLEIGEQATTFEKFSNLKEMWVQAEFLLSDKNGVCDEYNPITGEYISRCETFIYDGTQKLKDGYVCDTATPEVGSIIVQSRDKEAKTNISLIQNKLYKNAMVDPTFEYLNGYNEIGYSSELDTDINFIYYL